MARVNVICGNKSTLNWSNAARRLNGWLARDYGLLKHEWCYIGIEPRILCEDIWKIPTEKFRRTSKYSALAESRI
jgi:hypothetical protein